MTTDVPTSASAPERALGDRYRLIAPIGRGASATVYLAQDTSLRRQVAVKVLHEGLLGDAAFHSRFRKEAQSAAALSHPNIMAVHDWGDGEQPYLVMEYLGGGSLRSMLNEEQTLSPSQAIAVGLEACRGLHYAHDKGLVHRDIKPANLLFGHEGRLRIADFGLARALADAGNTEQGGLLGTARYASPEQARGESLTPASDVYSLGLVLVEALTGQLPFTSDTTVGTLMARVDNDVPIPDLPPKLADALRDMTRRDPDQRPTSTKAGVALLNAAEGLPRPRPLALAGALAEQIELDAGDRTVHAEVDATEIGGTPTVDGDGDEPRRRWPWILVSIVALASVAWLGWSQLEGALPADVTVPEVAGMSRDAALAELGDTWVLSEKFDRVVDVPAGSVIRTNPLAGETLTEGETLEYWVSLGLPLVRVPEDEIIGRSLAQADATLVSEGLTVGEVAEVNHEIIAAGLVVSVSAPAAEVPQGAPVDLVVSLGPELRKVPDPGELTVDEYVEQLVAVGLEANVTEDWDPEVPEGGFVSITPDVGDDIAKGEVAEIVVSLGPQPVPVPRTSGLALTPAIDALAEVGLLAGELGGSGLAGCPVVGTDPPEGTLVQPGNPVMIITSDC